MSVFSPLHPASTGHDDLAALFTRTLTLNPTMAAQLAASTSNPSIPMPTTPIYTSTHYTPPTSVSPPPTSVTPTRHHLSNNARLCAYGINPDSLSPSQMQLFRIANDTQQTRLLDLWKIFPPSLPDEDPANAWTATTVETEEQRAIIRFARLVGEQQQQQQQQQATQDDQMSDDINLTTPQSPAVHAQKYSASYSGWIGVDKDPFSEDGCGGSCAPEPYMMSGYEQIMQQECDAQILWEREQEQQRLICLDETARQREVKEREQERIWQEQRQQQQQQIHSTGSHESVVYSHFGSQVGGQQAVQYRPAAFDRVYENSPVVSTSREFQRMDMMVQPVGQYEAMEM